MGPCKILQLYSKYMLIMKFQSLALQLKLNVFNVWLF